MAWADSHITGYVVDGGSNTALDFVNIAVTKEGETAPTAGTVTDEQGKFDLEVKDGSYTISLSFMGYKEVKKQARIQGKDIHLGKIILTEDAQQLQELEVVAQGSTMRFELDKKIFSVDQSIASAGGSITDVLENIPSIDVDQEGNIALRNSDAVEIWINGKPAGLTAENRAQVLQQMPADAIKEIEVITNPSAKFSPEGTAGIINIVMKQDRKSGYYGSVSAGMTYGLAEPWTIPPSANTGFNFNFTKGIVDGYFNAGYRYQTMNGGSKSERYNLNGTDTLSHLLQTGQNDVRGHSLFLRGGLDFRISKISTIGISGFGMVADKGSFSSMSHNVNTYTLINQQTGDVLRDYTRTQTGEDWHPGGNAMLTYQLKLNKHSLSLSAAYNHFGFNQDYLYTQAEQEDTTRQEQLSLSLDQNVQIKADYEWKPTAQSRLEAGYQGDLSWRKTNSQAYDVFGLDATQEIKSYYNDFSNTEQNHALYITYGNRFWDKFSVQVGLRGEYFKRHISTEYYKGTDLTLETRDTSYFQLFPSAYLSYEFDGGHALQLNYTRRIDRPRGHQINPRQNFSDSTNIQYGNPDLLPQYSNALELNYLKTWTRHTLSAGLYYRFADGVIQRVQYRDGDIMKSTFINIGVRHEAGVEIVGKNRLFGEILQLTTSLNFYYNGLQEASYTPKENGVEFATITIPKQDIFAFSARINAQFLFTKTFSGQLSANYRSPRVVAQGTSSHSYSIDLGLRKTFLNKQLALSFNIRDLLDSRARRTTTYGDGFWQYQERRWHSREIGLTLTYSFGNTQMNKPKQNTNAAGDMSGGGDYDMGDY